MNEAIIKLREGIPIFEEAINDLFSAKEYLLGDAQPTNEIGVYALFYKKKLRYIGEAKGSRGLKDRLLSKHISGDDRHTLHKVFISDYPNKEDRKSFIKSNIGAKWVSLTCPDTVSALERLLIWSLQPEWNKK